MKRFIFIAGMGFYAITFAVIFWATFLNMEDSRPSDAFVRNVNTRAKVRMPDFATFDLVTNTRDQATINPGHIEGLAGGQANVLTAYGEYYQSLYNDDGVHNYPSVSGGDDWYTEAVCWHCHSQFVRPLAYENYRWGPTSQVGEGAHESPTRYGTRRIGPDLQREGDARSDDWHYAHFNHPRYTVPQSIMAPYGNVSRYWYNKSRDDLDATQKAIDEWTQSDLKNAEESAVVEERWAKGFSAVAGAMNGDYNEYWILWKGRVAGSSTASPILRVAEKPKKRVRDLVAYVQTRGVGIGVTAQTDARIGDPANLPDANSTAWQRYIRKLEFMAGRWRIQAPVGRPSARPAHVMAPAELLLLKESIVGGGPTNPATLKAAATKEAWDFSIKRGGNLFLKKCSGCHGGVYDDGSLMELDLSASSKTLGLIGNGYGPAAAWLSPEPRNFHLAAKGTRDIDETGAEVADSYNLPRERGSLATRFKNRSGNPGGYDSANVGLARPEDLYHTIRNGMLPSAMPAWPFLTDWEVWDIVNFIMYLGDAEADVRAQVADYGSLEEARAGVASYWNITTVRESWDVRLAMPVLTRKPKGQPDAILATAPNARNLDGKAKEDYAAAYWASKLGLELDGATWSTPELVRIGQAIFEANTPVKTLSTGDNLPDCMSCHGLDGDGWSTRRGELFSVVGFPARNYYQGQFKLGATREDIWRAMAYGIAGTPMNPQVLPHFSSLEALAIAEFVLDKRNQGVYGIKTGE